MGSTFGSDQIEAHYQTKRPLNQNKKRLSSIGNIFILPISTKPGSTVKS